MNYDYIFDSKTFDYGINHVTFIFCQLARQHLPPTAMCTSTLPTNTAFHPEITVLEHLTLEIIAVILSQWVA